jgi:hypothetical protein
MWDILPGVKNIKLTQASQRPADAFPFDAIARDARPRATPMLLKTNTTASGQSRAGRFQANVISAHDGIELHLVTTY